MLVEPLVELQHLAAGAAHQFFPCSAAPPGQSGERCGSVLERVLERSAAQRQDKSSRKDRMIMVMTLCV